MKLIEVKKIELKNSTIFCLSKDFLILKEQDYITLYQLEHELTKSDEIHFEKNINCIQVKENKILVLDDYNRPHLYEKGDIIKEKNLNPMSFS
jgi:hypothetical protein